jgi:CubicO group peptidase (beta-lactamase class C family)
MDLAGIRMEDVFPDDAALALIARQKALNFTPGDDYLYSNSGYWLLGQTVERVTGESLREYARQKIFQPLGMAHTHFHDDPGHVMKDRVVSYAQTGGGYRVADLPNFDKIGAGGLYTTVEDLLKWDTNFYEPRIGSAEWLRLIQTPGALNNGNPLTYAFGLTIGTYRGLRTVRHGGSLMGFRAELMRFPDQKLTTIVLCNFAAIAPSRLAEQVAEVYLGAEMTAPAAPQLAGPGASASGAAKPGRGVATEAPLNREALAAYAGVYRSDEVQADYTIRANEGGLLLERPAASRTTLVRSGEDEFRAGNLMLRFRRDTPGTPMSSFTVQAGRVRNIVFERRQ